MSLQERFAQTALDVAAIAETVHDDGRAEYLLDRKANAGYAGGENTPQFTSKDISR